MAFLAHPPHVHPPLHGSVQGQVRGLAEEGGWSPAGAAWGWYLGLGEVELPGELGPLAAHHVLAALELHLQAVQLLSREGCACPLGSVQVQALGQDNFPNGPLGICGGP